MHRRLWWCTCGGVRAAVGTMAWRSPCLVLCVARRDGSSGSRTSSSNDDSRAAWRRSPSAATVYTPHDGDEDVSTPPAPPPPPSRQQQQRRQRPAHASTVTATRHDDYAKHHDDNDDDDMSSSSSSTDASQTAVLWLAAAPTQPVVLDGLGATATVQTTAAATSAHTHTRDDVDGGNERARTTQAARRDTARTVVVTARRLWAATRVARASRHVRVREGVCVVGGAEAVRRVWRTYAVRPLVVFVPDTDAAVPTWCTRAALPTYVVRASPVAVRRQLLSAEYSDGYAAAFPLAALTTRWPPLSTLLQPPPSSSLPSVVVVDAMLVLVGLRVPSNVGVLLRAAVDMGYDSVLLIDCVDVTHEKVLRASGGAVFAPTLRVYTHRSAATDDGNGDDHRDATTAATQQQQRDDDDDDATSCVSLLSRIAQQHNLLPLLAVPSQDASPAFATAARLFAAAASSSASSHNGDEHAVQPSPPSCGDTVSLPRPMLVLGGEATGLRVLSRGRWRVPYELVTLPMPHGGFVDSHNVAVAGAALMHTFRRAAAAHYATRQSRLGDGDNKDAHTAAAALLPPPPQQLLTQH